ncbi:unnamed protein product [Thlaspi arvense]|uniref:Uncharacterized protein n=1 Tax=Thlaspi arvense TaxID=13288 RepID=A0AAU9RF14_THLAR|nr:unnamed protein product [Thlaspi arvense]
MENGSGNEINQNDLLDDFINPFHDSSTSLSLSRDPVSEFMDTVSPSQDQPAGNLPEMFLPGTIIHVVPNNNGMEGTLWKNWRIPQKYKVYTVDRNSFKDIIVSPSMFLDHLPWRCDFALRKALEEMSAQNLYERSDIV